MTQRDFLGGLGRVVVFGALLALGLRVGLGARWFGFYGAATVALATLPFLTRLLWRRLPASGLSRWWTLAYALPAALVAAVQIGYWVVFFATGPDNPMLGVVREMLRPVIDLISPLAVAALLAVWGYILMHAASRRTIAD